MFKILLSREFHEISSPILLDEEYQKLKKFTAHGRYSVYDHSLRVALFAYSYAKEKNLQIDYSSLIRGCLLHDFYLYDWHHAHEGHSFHGFRHPYFALRNAKERFSLNNKEKNMIVSHMFPLTFWTIPLSKEAWILTYSDKVCANAERKKTLARKH